MKTVAFFLEEPFSRIVLAYCIRSYARHFNRKWINRNSCKKEIV
jgi:hypothetical protein